MSNQRVKLQHGRKLLGFRIVKCVGSGGYGDTYYVVRESDGAPFAMKVERTNARKQALEGEVEFFKSLQPSPYLPEFIEFGEESGYRVLVLELLGPSFDRIAKARPKRTLTIPSLLRLSVQMVRAIQAFHNEGFVHNDIKPDNFLLKLNSENFVCLIDFGLAKKYVDDTGDHIIRDMLVEKFKGTLAFASPGMLKSRDTSRRDDLYSWFYAVMVLMFGKLPWGGEKSMKRVRRMKRHIRETQLYQDMPKCYHEVYEYISGIQFYDDPDYDRITDEIEKEIQEQGVDWDSPYDWEELPEGVVREFSAFPLSSRSGVKPFEEHEVVDKERAEQDERKRAEFRKQRNHIHSQACLLL